MPPMNEMRSTSEACIFIYMNTQLAEWDYMFKGLIIVDCLSNAFSDENPSNLLAWSEDFKYIVQII